MKRFFSALALVLLAAVCMAHGAAAHAGPHDCSTVYATAKATPELSILVAAVEAADLNSTLDDPSLEATVFAPTNDAFMAALEALGISAEELLSSTELLTDILTYHVVPVAAFSGNLTDGQVVPTLLEDQTITVKLEAEDVVLETESGGNSTVILADIDACEAVVHVVDTVLLPDLESVDVSAEGV